MDRPSVSTPEALRTRRLSGAPSSIPKLGSHPLSEYPESVHLLADALVRGPTYIIILNFLETPIALILSVDISICIVPIASETPSAFDDLPLRTSAYVCYLRK